MPAGKAIPPGRGGTVDRRAPPSVKGQVTLQETVGQVHVPLVCTVTPKVLRASSSRRLARQRDSTQRLTGCAGHRAAASHSAAGMAGGRGRGEGS